VTTAIFDVRFWGQSGHSDVRWQCPLMTKADIPKSDVLESARRNISLNEEIERRIAATKAEKRQGRRLPCRKPGNPGPAMAAGTSWG
jgi:hypothetical protein